MFIEKPIYKVICDKCKKDSTDGTEYAGWTDKGTALDVAYDADFTEVGDKHYCSDCYEMLDDE